MFSIYILIYVLFLQSQQVIIVHQTMGWCAKIQQATHHQEHTVKHGVQSPTLPVMEWAYSKWTQVPACPPQGKVETAFLYWPLWIWSFFTLMAQPAASLDRTNWSQQVLQSQQPPQRQGVEGAHNWYNCGQQQPQSTHNGATGTGGSMETGYLYTGNIGEDLFQNLIGNHQPVQPSKQEAQGSSNMAMLGLSSDCGQSFTALLNSTIPNGSTAETVRQMEVSGPNQRVSQISYPVSGMGQENHLDSFTWQYFPE